MDLLKCENLSFSYEGRIALENVNFTVEEGDYICVLGENGAGKSTLIKGLLKLIKPADGKIEYIEGFSSKYIGYLPQQQSVKKDFPASVWEVVLSGSNNLESSSILSLISSLDISYIIPNIYILSVSGRFGRS